MGTPLAKGVAFRGTLAEPAWKREDDASGGGLRAGGRSGQVGDERLGPGGRRSRGVNSALGAERQRGPRRAASKVPARDRRTWNAVRGRKRWERFNWCQGRGTSKHEAGSKVTNRSGSPQSGQRGPRGVGNAGAVTSNT